MTTYYVDSVSGSDTNSGVTTGTPWKTASKVTAGSYAPGDQILFKRGSTFTADQLQIWDSGTSSARIVIGNYGTSGANPIFDGNNTIVPVVLGGNWITFQDVTVRKAGDRTNERIGVGVFGTDVLIQRVYVTACALGIQIFDGAHRCRVTNSNISDNNVGLIGPGSNDDYGAQGITVKSADGCEIDHNVLDRNLTVLANWGSNPDYTEDGTAVEVFGATNLLVHHNTADGNQTFCELGLHSTGDCTFYSNLITGSHDYQLGFNVKGTDEPEYGPLTGTTRIYNNTIDLTGFQTCSVAIHAGNTASVHNNVFRDTGTNSGTRSSTYGQKVDEGNNVWYGGTYTEVWSTANGGNGLASTSTIANPLFVSSTDRSLQAGSPAINRGSSNYGYTTDLAGNIRPSSNVDAGAYEYQAATSSGPANPTGIADTTSIGTPTVAALPTPTGNTYGAGTYGSGLYGPAAPTTLAPTGITATTTVGSPTAAMTAITIAPTGMVDATTAGAPSTSVNATSAAANPDSLLDTSTATAPSINTSAAVSATPNSLVDTDTEGTPGVSSTYSLTAGTLADTTTTGAPTATASTLGALTYSAGTYGAGTYSGYAPDSLRDTETLGQPGVTGYSGTSTAASIRDSDTLTPPAATVIATAPPDDASRYNLGDYGAGIYPGTSAKIPASITDGTTPGTPAVTGGTPGDAPVPGGAAAWAVPTYGDPLHILGIGPWNPQQPWRGAPNHGVAGGRAPARPHLQLPGVQSKAFTLRLNDGCEATASLQFDRTGAVIVEEMSTDLWWLRKDPRTGALEVIGRFNASHNDLARADDGTVTSNVQFVDYRTLLGNRLILKYLDPTHSESQWAKATPITRIMKFAVPADLGLDLSALDDDDLLGVTTSAYYVAPSTSIADMFAQLSTISAKPFEWWIETPTDLTKAPKLTFAYGKRGANKGVTLVDLGSGPTPIASWTMRATSDTYANALYFQGKDGGVITTIPAQITQYGERDAQDSDSSVTGAMDASGQPASLIAAARRRLTQMSDRRPTFTIVLRPGFWRGRSHIDVGDTIGVRIKLGNDALTFYDYRVTEIHVEIDGNGAETVTLTLGNPLASRNPRSGYSPLMKVIKKLKNYTPPAGAPTFDTTPTS